MAFARDPQNWPADLDFWAREQCRKWDHKLRSWYATLSGPKSGVYDDSLPAKDLKRDFPGVELVRLATRDEAESYNNQLAQSSSVQPHGSLLSAAPAGDHASSQQTETCSVKGSHETYNFYTVHIERNMACIPIGQQFRNSLTSFQTCNGRYTRLWVRQKPSSRGKAN